MRTAGTTVSSVVVQSLWPIPETALLAAFESVERIVVPELNMGLYSREIERIAAGKEIVGVNRIDGGLITIDEIMEAVR